MQYHANVYSRWAIAAAAAAAVCSLIVLAALIFFALPMGDDFCHVFAGPANLWSQVVRTYYGRSGRWASAGIVPLITGSSGDLLRNYSGRLAALLLLRLVAAYVLARAVLHPATTKRFCALAAGSFSLLYWSAMPATGDSLFWLTGTLELELAATVLLLLAAILWSARLTPLRGLAAAPLAALLTGQHELAGVAVCIVLMGGCALAYRGRSRNLWIWVALLVVAGAGLLIEIGAPGNYVRAASQGTKWRLPSALGMTAVNMTAWLPRWMLDAPLLLSALLALIEPRIRLREEWNRAEVRICVLSVWLAALASGFFVPSLALNGLLPGRVLNWLYLLFITGLFANLLLWKLRWPLPARRPVCSAILAAAFAAMFFGGNPWLGAADLVLRIPHWYSARSASLKSLRGESSGAAAFLPSLPATPHMYFDYDAASDPSEYPNRCLAEYFGLKTVVSPNTGQSPRGAALSGRTQGLLNRP